jgi:hypothetical protein
MMMPGLRTMTDEYPLVIKRNRAFSAGKHADR